MKYEEAERIIVEAVSTTAGLAELTPAPTREQQAAIRTLTATFDDRVAPEVVCGAMDIEQDSTWGIVLREVAVDVTGSA